MKKSFKLILFIPLFVLFIQSSCKKDTPKITTYGAYKFAAKVNGKDFIPSGDVLANPIDISFYQASNPANTNLYVLGYRIENHEMISLYIRDIKGPGHYSFNTVTAGYPYQSEPPHCGMYDKDNNAGIANHWVTNNIDTGYIDNSEYKLTNNV